MRQIEGDWLCFGELLAARVREAGSGEVLFVQAVQKEEESSERESGRISCVSLEVRFTLVLSSSLYLFTPHLSLTSLFC